MIMGEDLKNEIRVLNRLGDYRGAMKILQRYRSENYAYLCSEADKIFLDYCLAFHYYKDVPNKDMANMYLKCIETVFNNERVISENEADYFKYLWLYINVNKSTLPKYKVIKDLHKVYNFYHKANLLDVALTVKETIYSHMNDEEGMLNTLEELMKIEVRDSNFIDSILRDCEKISNSLYIKALQIVEQSNIQMVNHF